jgi:hypothetical protein
MNRYKHQETEEFIALFNGKWQPVGKSVAYDRTFEFLQSQFEKGGVELLVMTINLIMSVYQTPAAYLFAGKTKKSQLGDGKAINAKLAKMLPMLSDEDIADVKDSIVAREAAGYKREFTRVNQTMIRRIAMISSEFLDKTFSRSLEGYFSCWGASASLLDENSPSIKRIKPNDDGVNRTRDIKLEQLDQHRAEKNYWDDERFASIFEKLE